MRVQCPAKINLNLKIVNRRDDGFHNIESVMQTISLYDYLTIDSENSAKTSIELSGNSDEIPYDERNLVYKAAQLFLNETKISNKNIKIYIEKNIPIEAGLGGGSADAAGTLFGLNEIFNKPLNRAQLNEQCAKLGSDLNVCLNGGRLLCKGRGEILEQLPFEEFDVNLIKPIGLGISAKEAYTKFSQKVKTPDRHDFINDLEWAIIDDYPQLQQIRSRYKTANMTGSGSTYFSIGDNYFEECEGFWVKNNLKAVSDGVCVA